MDIRGFSVGVKRSEREADHSPPTSAEVKNAWCLVKHRILHVMVLEAQGQLYLLPGYVFG